jgi:hypothetical protein
MSKLVECDRCVAALNAFQRCVNKNARAIDDFFQVIPAMPPGGLIIAGGAKPTPFIEDLIEGIQDWFNKPDDVPLSEIVKLLTRGCLPMIRFDLEADCLPQSGGGKPCQNYQLPPSNH